MGAEVTFRDEGKKRNTTVRVVYPNEADIGQRNVSVLTPVGSALIGLPEGARMALNAPGGTLRALTVLRVVRQA